MSTQANLQHLRLIAEDLDDAAARQVKSAIAELEAARRRAVAVLGTCDKHRTSPVHIYSNCAGCELERLNAEVESLKNKARWATENHNQLDALAQRCRNLEAVQQAGLESSGRIKSAAGALGWTADREDSPLEFLIEQAQRCRELQEDRQRTADELVAFVHGEHSAVCAERDNLKAAFTEWLDKAEWVHKAISTASLPIRYLGMHRADAMRAEIERLQAINYRQEQQIATLTADPNGWQAGYNKGRHDGTKTRLSELEQERRINRELRDQLREQREDYAVGAALQRAACELPEGFEIHVEVERGAGTARLYDPNGDEINEAIDTAMEAPR